MEYVFIIGQAHFHPQFEYANDIKEEIKTLKMRINIFR